MPNVAQEWNVNDIGAYKRLLDLRAAWEQEQEEMARLRAEAEELDRDLESVALEHLGRIWLQGLPLRIAPKRRQDLKGKLIRSLRQHYDKAFARKRTEGVDEEVAHRAAIQRLRSLRIKPDTFTADTLRKGPKPRSYRKALPILLTAYKRWLPKVWAVYQEIRQADFPEAALLRLIPEANDIRASDRIVDGKVIPPFALAVLLACRELGIDLRLENGETDPRLSTLRKLAKALRVTVAELIGEAKPARKRARGK